jgi:hypothetical protein
VSAETLQFEVKSLLPSQSPEQLVEQIRRSLPNIAKELEPTLGRVSLDLERAETFPVDQQTIYLVIKAVAIAGASGVAKTVGEKVGGELYDALKRRFKNASIRAVAKRSTKKH